MSLGANAVVQISHKELEAKLENIPGKEGVEIRYGYDLLLNTPYYFGTKGKLKKNKNSRMSCANCHIEVGTKEFGNSWLNTHFNYPQYRGREGKIQTLPERINVCLKHPTQASEILENSREMKAMLLYIAWVGKGRLSPLKDADDRLIKLNFLERMANPEKGKLVYENRCQTCHGKNGEGRLKEDELAYIYPPLWGPGSFINGSSMSRLSILARFIRANMPFGAVAIKPELTNEEVWDVASFINTKPRKPWNDKIPFPNLKDKPFDYPIPPYEDKFSNEQHLKGPFQPIVDFQNEQKRESLNSMGI